LYTLERRSMSVKEIGEECGLPYGVVLYHLHLLLDEGSVGHKGKRPYLWFLTGFGQKRLM